MQRYSRHQCLTRAVLPFYSRMVITVFIVYQRGQNVLLPPFTQRNKCTFRIFFSTVLIYLLPNRKQFFLYFLLHLFLHFVNKQHQHQSNYIQIDQYNCTLRVGQLISPMLPTQTIGAFRHSFTAGTRFCFSRALNCYSIAFWVLS